mgnify:CR=1 FL=1
MPRLDGLAPLTFVIFLAEVLNSNMICYDMIRPDLRPMAIQIARGQQHPAGMVPGK